ncbi:zinc-binding dehydrogenase [Lichenihabitans sp. PAMC28606]|uniref:zinc-binding dehydrogenase n=1 Tax=Lichenihabitans TaxID=2723776 RepID=UPI00103844CB|nr:MULTISPECIES: alcohol dehydrogenase catalytic domain-containing protein [Lichenihabitans]UDL94745.1 zinc-binding dehydrogenase [Lichenihabitans sp. PAMC28606]
MKAIVLREHGGLEQLRYETVADPVVTGNMVVVQIRASGLNHCDIDVRNGTFGVEQKLPHVMGVDAAGEVVAIGHDVSLWKVGDRVAPHFVVSCGHCAHCRSGRENICENADILGVTVWGGYAEKLMVPESNLIALPDSVSFIDAAASMVPFATAWEALITTARLQAGETVLINAAGGGVGSHAVQIARLAGARVIASVGADDKIDKVMALGADAVINYRKETLVDGVQRLTSGRGVDVVLDGVGGDILKQSLKALGDGGRLASIGAHGGEIVDIDMIEFFRKHITLLGCGRSTREIAATVLGLMAAGRLKAVLQGTFPLAKAADAQALMESRNFFGRIVLQPEA